MKMIIRIIALSALLTISSFSLFSQCSQYFLSIDQRMQEANTMVEAEVTGIKSYWNADRSNIYTAYELSIYKSWKNTPLQDKIYMILGGGMVGLDMQVDHPNVTYQIGDKGIFLLKAAANNRVQTNKNISLQYEPVSLEQSRWIYDLYDLKAANAFESININHGAHYQWFNNATNTSFKEHKAIETDFRPINKQSESRSITSFSPTTITAGTNSVLTITGSNFGGTQGTVYFRDANTGGGTYTGALSSQVISWTNTEIQVEVPSRAGTGTIRVITSGNTEFNSSNSLNVTCAESQINSSSGGTTQAYSPHLAKVGNESHDYLFQIHQELWDADAPNARSSFGESVNSWACETSVNWSVALSPSNVDVSASDGINIVRIENGEELGAGRLGVATSRYSGCFIGGTLTWVVSEVDLTFDKDISWNYGTSNPSPGQADFITVATHELGHAQQLSHVIDQSKVMHYASIVGQANRNITADEMSCAHSVQVRSVSGQPCAANATNQACNANLAMILPVELISFDVKAVDNNALIQWVTASELNNDYFNIQHSTDLINWESVADIDGSNSLGATYTYKHENIASGIHYYRLKQVDLDGAETIFDIKSIDIKSKLRHVYLKGNMIQDALIVANPSSQEMKYQIINMAGKMIQSGELQPADNLINTANFESGVYLLRLHDGSTYKFIRI